MPGALTRISRSGQEHMNIQESVITEIRELHDEIGRALRNCLESAIRIGGLLCQVKADLKHGEFGEWIKANLPFTDRTARNYMNVYRRRDELKTETVSDLTGAYRLLGAPKEDAFILVQSAMEHRADAAGEVFMSRAVEHMKQYPPNFEGKTSDEVLETMRYWQGVEQLAREYTLECERALGETLIAMKQVNEREPRGKYQIWPDLPDDVYSVLKASIDEHGVLVPVEYDEEGNILDGHQRVKICRELGITAWPRLIRKGMTEKEKMLHVVRLQCARKNDPDMQREWIHSQTSHGASAGCSS